MQNRKTHFPIAPWIQRRFGKPIRIVHFLLSVESHQYKSSLSCLNSRLSGNRKPHFRISPWIQAKTVKNGSSKKANSLHENEWIQNSAFDPYEPCEHRLPVVFGYQFPVCHNRMSAVNCNQLSGGDELGGLGFFAHFFYLWSCGGSVGGWVDNVSHWETTNDFLFVPVARILLPFQVMTKVMTKAHEPALKSNEQDEAFLTSYVENKRGYLRC